ncbi:MAG: hypothetical protein DCF16_14390 [Alphaproteobacteria bacterium]|nr:MAG: hypothetical protein DCF16_14390 [Alphaproteobacteria bacterium]
MTRKAFEIGAVCVALALLATFAFLLSHADGMVLANGQPVFGDFIAFWSGGRAALEGHVADAHTRALIEGYHQQAAPGVAYVAPWNSPPTFLLIASALALLPYPFAAITFIATSGALYLYAARKLLPDARAMIFALTLPAALYHLGSAQTGLLVAGVSGLALTWLDRRPLTAGALVGLLAVKPHLAIFWPIMLAVSGRWRAFAAASVSSLAFIALAGAVFGFESYVRFFENLGATQNLVTSQLIATPAYASLYASLLQLGAPQSVAIGAHAAFAVVGVGLALRVFLTKDRVASGAALCAVTLIALPYCFFYDFTLLAVGAAVMGAPCTRLELAAAVAAWSAGLSLVLSYVAPLPYCALAAWLLLAAASVRARSAAAQPAPAPQP